MPCCCCWWCRCWCCCWCCCTAVIVQLLLSRTAPLYPITCSNYAVTSFHAGLLNRSSLPARRAREWGPAPTHAISLSDPRLLVSCAGLAGGRQGSFRCQFLLWPRCLCPLGLLGCIALGRGLLVRSLSWPKHAVNGGQAPYL